MDKKILTLFAYRDNPSGKGASFIPNGAEIKEKYKTEMESKEEDIKCRWYKVKDKTLYCHIKLPSKSLSSLMYDVVFEFNLVGIEEYFDGKSIGSIPFKFFSNCPSFTYTYANVFDEYKLIINWLKNKYETEVFKYDPDIRNGYKIISYEKSMYISTLYILDGRDRLDVTLSMATELRNTSEIYSLINTSDYIMATYKIEKKKSDDANKKEKYNQPKEIKKSVDQSIDYRTKKTHTTNSTKSKKSTTSSTSKTSKSTKRF